MVSLDSALHFFFTYQVYMYLDFKEAIIETNCLFLAVITSVIFECKTWWKAFEQSSNHKGRGCVLFFCFYCDFFIITESCGKLLLLFLRKQAVTPNLWRYDLKLESCCVLCMSFILFVRFQSRDILTAMMTTTTPTPVALQCRCFRTCFRLSGGTTHTPARAHTTHVHSRHSQYVIHVEKLFNKWASISDLKMIYNVKKVSEYKVNDLILAFNT